MDNADLAPGQSEQQAAQKPQEPNLQGNDRISFLHSRGGMEIKEGYRGHRGGAGLDFLPLISFAHQEEDSRRAGSD